MIVSKIAIWKDFTPNKHIAVTCLTFTQHVKKSKVFQLQY